MLQFIESFFTLIHPFPLSLFSYQLLPGLFLATPFTPCFQLPVFCNKPFGLRLFSRRKCPFPVGKWAFPVRFSSFPIGKCRFPVRKWTFPVGFWSFPTRFLPFPNGKRSFPNRKQAFSNGFSSFSNGFCPFSNWKWQLARLNRQLSIRKVTKGLRNVPIFKTGGCTLHTLHLITSFVLPGFTLTLTSNQESNFIILKFNAYEF